MGAFCFWSHLSCGRRAEDTVSLTSPFRAVVKGVSIGSMPTHLIAIDQGTTSTRAIVFDDKLAPVAVAQQELRQIYPAPGWVEHDPEEIWSSRGRDRARGDGQGRRGRQGHRRHRHHQPARDHDRLGSRQRQADPQRHRLAGPAHRRRLRGAARAPGTRPPSRTRPASCSIRISRRPRSAGCSTMWIGARAAAEQGRLAFGTVDSFLLWRLTGGKVHATDATNASRTLLFDIGRGAWDQDLLRAVRASRAACCRRSATALPTSARRGPICSAARSASAASPATSRRRPSGRAASRPA